MNTFIIGIDEVGRGPIAGPLVVCACAIKIGTPVLQLFPQARLLDSKKLSEKQRVSIVEKIQQYIDGGDIFFGIGEIAATHIDEIGLRSSLQEAVHTALHQVHRAGVAQESFIFLDGSLHVDKKFQQETIIKGDEKVLEIALASIFAKVYRDSLMKKAALVYPHYGFESHVGYGTRAHYEAIKNHGITPLHRKSFLKNSI